MSLPAVHAILVVKDEVDVVENAVRTTAPWATRILALDNGSSDGTFELLQELRREVPQLQSVERDPQPFFDGIRANVYQAHRSGASVGDWWMHLDADERVVEDPRPLLAQVTPDYNAVAGAQYQYQLVRDDVEAYQRDPAGWLARPVEDRLHWYRNDSHAIRFVRPGRFSRWRSTPYPEGPVRVWPDFVALRHYQHRSPEQIDRRYRLRTGRQGFDHVDKAWKIFEPAPEGAAAWERRIAIADMLDYDDGGPLRERREVMPGVEPLRPGWRRGVEDVLALTGLFGAVRGARDLVRGARRG